MNKFIYLGSEWAESHEKLYYWEIPYYSSSFYWGYSTFLFSPFSP